MHDEPIQPAQPSRRNLRLTLWAMFSILLVTFVGFGLWENALDEQALSAWELRLPARSAAIKTRVEELRARRDWAPEQIELYLGARLEFDPPSRPDPHRRVGIWFDPETLGSYRLEFTDGLLTWVSATGPPDSEMYVPSLLWRIGNAVRSALLFWIPLPWLALIVLFCFIAPARRALAEVAMGLAILRLCAWLLPPRGWPSAETLHFDREALYLGLMLVCSGVAVLLVYRPRRSLTAPLCHICRYNLTGNISGICPECGTPLPRWVIRRLTTPILPPAILPAELREHVEEEFTTEHGGSPNHETGITKE